MDNTKEKTPKAYSLRLTENAHKNIEEITAYIAHIKHLPLNAICVGDKIIETINRILQNPLWHLKNAKKFRPKPKFIVKRFA